MEILSLWLLYRMMQEIIMKKEDFIEILLSLGFKEVNFTLGE